MERAAAGSMGRSVDIVHQHCLWLANSRTTFYLYKNRKVPSVIAPHGSLEPWALQRSSLKKRIALSLYERNNLYKASCLHALSELEVTGFREFGLRNPIAIIKNGISQSWLDSEGDSAGFRSKFNIHPEKRIALFLSRITPVKGIPLLIEALAMIRETLDNWILVLAGADEFHHLREIQAAVNKNNLDDHVVFSGLLADQTKRDAYAAADLFVLPTRREAAPIVVLEALGAGIPVITTKGAPWQDLITHDCGWWTDISANALASALKDAAMKSPAALKAMGGRGRTLVSSHYTWKQAAQMTIKLYEWLLGRGERPAFVITD
jgi:glycosyltransferase involved in cell wall biosynthesis